MRKEVECVHFGYHEGLFLNDAFLQIYDITGRLVATLVDEELLPGEYETVWDARKVSSGVYLVTLQIGTAVKSQKVVLLK